MGELKIQKTIEELDLSSNISKYELLNVLKNETSNIHTYDLMRTSAYLQQEEKYLKKYYKENFDKMLINNFISRFKDVKEDKREYTGYVDGRKLHEFLKTLKQQREIQKKDLKILSEEFFQKFSKITQIVAIYSTFILETSIHSVGTKFPGEFSVKFENGIYLCPVKKKNINNPYALCRFCVAKQS